MKRYARNKALTTMADNSLKDQAAVIRDETAAGKNTATRVGSLLVDMCGSLETAAAASALATETAAREAGDKTLRTDLDANYNLLAGVIDTTIPKEVAERKAADAALVYRIDNCDNLILDIKKGFCDMGEFETEAKALSALGDLAYCSSNAYCILHAHYSKEGKECNMVCTQSFNEDAENDKHLVRQFLFNRDKVWQRCIYFTDKTRTEIKSRDNWEATFCDRLHWDADTRKLVPSLFGHTFNKDYTDAIPLSNSTTDGLMSKTQAAMLDSASAEIGAYAYASAAMTAAQTAQAGFNDFKVWRASAAADALTLKVSSSTTATKYEAKFPCATETTAGVMTAAQAKKLADLEVRVAALEAKA